MDIYLYGNCNKATTCIKMEDYRNTVMEEWIAKMADFAEMTILPCSIKRRTSTFIKDWSRHFAKNG